MLFRFPHSSWLPACRRLLLLLPALALAAGLSARSLVKADVQLANNAVLAMYQDEDANMWIGTYDGLHLYNGKNTFVFRMELDNEFSLCSNIVLEIAPAEKGYLWVATSLGINKFSLRERRVVESYMQYVDVENITSDSEGNTVLFSGEDFITCYRPGRAFFEDVYIPGVRAAEIGRRLVGGTPGVLHLGAGRRVGALPAQRRRREKSRAGIRAPALRASGAQGVLQWRQAPFRRHLGRAVAVYVQGRIAGAAIRPFAAGRNRALPCRRSVRSGTRFMWASWPGPWAVFPRKEAAAS